jgi:TRAP-type uncharacterized transport system fused permease subunit
MEPILKKRVIRGGIIALVLIVCILIITSWDTRSSKFWMIVPLILVTVAGGAGGYAFHRFDEMQQRQRISETLSVFLSLLVYLILLLVAYITGTIFWD